MSTPTEEYANPLGGSPAMADGREDTPGSSGVVTSAEAGSPANPESKPKGKKRVGFTGGSAEPSRRTSFVETSPDGTQSPLNLSPPVLGSPVTSVSDAPLGGLHIRRNSGDDLLPADKSHLPQLSKQTTDQLRDSIQRGLDVPRPRPAIRHGPSFGTEPGAIDAIHPHSEDGTKTRSAREAFERGKRLEQDELSYSAANSRQSSPNRGGRIPSLRSNGIPLRDLDDRSEQAEDDVPPMYRARRPSHTEAFNLVRRHTAARDVFHAKQYDGETPPMPRSGATTPTEEQRFMEDYQPRPQQYRGGILGAILKLYNDGQASTDQSRRNPGLPRAHLRQHSGDYSALSSPASSPPSSGTSTPVGGGRHWYSHKGKDAHSTSSLATLIGSSSAFGSPAVTGLGASAHDKTKEYADHAKRPPPGSRAKSGALGNAINRLSKGPRAQEAFKITEHIAETIARQKYLLKLCNALMLYGAPTHRLEEYMTMSARVLETDAQFLYIPGAMIISFEDRTTHTSEVKLVRVPGGLDLGKLRDVHEIYKEVVHDKLGVGEATERLTAVTSAKPKHHRLVRVPVYGLAAVCVGPFAFQARLIDLPIAFILGCILGILQLYVAPASDLYANVFEIAATVITSFLARAFGSIRGGNLFCFSALAQSSIALILPGYTVLCASLELQSKSLVAGSVRMVYAIIYSLFLGYGITIGTVIYGAMDPNAVSEITCHNPMPKYWFFFFVPGFAMCLIIINQGKWKQAPVMLLIAFIGYIVNYFSSQRFPGNGQVSNTLGALAIGVLANLYSRIGGRMENHCWDIWEERLRPHWRAFRKRVFRTQSRRKSPKSLEEGSIFSDNESIFQPARRRVGYGLAAAAMLPAIFVQVPSGIAVGGSLLSGIQSANQIVHNETTGGPTTVSSASSGQELNSSAFTVGYSVIQVAIGITVGLFLSAIVVYPFGKRRSGLFSF